jgi:hypothetical protein
VTLGGVKGLVLLGIELEELELELEMVDTTMLAFLSELGIRGYTGD